MFDARDVLLKAAERISEEGMWCQGNFFRGPVSAWTKAVDFVGPTSHRMAECVMGALISSAIELGLNGEGYDAAAEILKRAIGNEYLDDWNDTPGRTAHEVASAIRAAAS